MAVLEEVVDILDSRRVPVNAKERAQREGPIPYYGATGQVGTISDYLFDEELVLLGEDGAPFLDASKPKAYVIRGKSWVNNHAHVLRSLGGIPSAYVKHYLDTVDYHSFVTGTTRLKLNQAAMRQIPVPLAPAAEQKRIVAEIEKQFSRLDEAVANLKRVQANLKRYKAAVLKAAVEGKLTEEWRKQHPDVEPADQLLERILAERRAKWEEAELEKMKAKGKVAKGAGWKDKYPSPANCEEGLPTAPPSWTIASLEALTSAARVICYGILMPKENVPDGVLYVKVKDMKEDRIDLQGLHRTVPAIAAKYERASLREGDLLLSIRGTYGRVAEVPRELEGANITQDTARLDVSSHLDARFVALHLRSSDSQNFFKRVARGVAVKGVNIGDVRTTPIYVPPLKEQRRIVQEVEAVMTVIEEIGTDVDFNLKRADRLRQSILQKAFSGQLVPQDPTDEPASVLLERIRAERAAPRRAGLAPPVPSSAPRAWPWSPRPYAAGGAPPYGGNNPAAAVLAFLQPGQEYSRADVVDALGLTVGQWNEGIRELKESGAVVQRGERRGARYRKSQ